MDNNNNNKILKFIFQKINLYQQSLNFFNVQPFLNKLDNVKHYQTNILTNIINENQKSKYGIDNKFKFIKDIEGFKKNIKINKYEDLEPYIKESISGKDNSIISKKIIYYAMTSGTTSEPKYIPHTQNYIRKLKMAWQVWIYKTFETNPGAFSLFGSILTFTSKPYEGKTKLGIGYGSVSGLIHDIQPSYVRFLYGAPNEVLLIEDFELKNYLILLFSLKKNLTLMVAPNPSTLIIYAKGLNKHYYNLINDLKSNSIKLLENDKTVDENLKKILIKKFVNEKENKKIYLKLKKIKAQHNEILPKYFFENLKTIGCWKGGNVGIYVDKLPKYYGNDVTIRDIGYMASEGRFSIPIKDSIKGDGILDITTNFYEFIEVEEYDKGIRDTLLANELEKDKKYYIIITNENGLYRYFIDDIIEVCDFYEKTPIVRFLQKGKYFSSITGEKISEWEVIEAIDSSTKYLKIDYHTFFVYPRVVGDNVFYEYHIEFEKKLSKDTIKELALKIDLKLKQLNIEYISKRESKRLGVVKIKILPRNSMSHIKLEFSKGKSHDTQIKVPKLIVLDKDKAVLKKMKLI